MSIAQVVEACELHAKFVKLGYYYRARTCLDIALNNLKQLKSVTTIQQVAQMIDNKEMQCLKLQQELNTKIKNRILVKITAYQNKPL
ncbi:hypothetical protein [Epiphyas postvittana nucleopolyhedrovirus]|uniref:Uncharacterized protein n=1 Tax=Epiphyas postvittana nucleopolyhedrovirus TaxID=70600 RepID=Q91GE7_NPVEP|nr:hypothetical protein [Epiphyas postvittana nucleopolyhedrovirus]AAK85671.1 unknown [Epiphyas postvittana nucleopolyhedrovirus]